MPAAPQAPTPLPNWLTQPIGNAINPPIDTRLQSLPYQELDWKDFERLCLRLAQRDAAVEGCRLYGEQGDTQAGIDLYAREFDGEKYVVYQCKRVQDFGPAKIKAAVDKFLEADGFTGLEQISTFVLCTMESLRGQQRDDMFRAQEKVLRAQNIQLERWDEDELNHRLKELPEVVDDFFGRPWVEAFCGVDAAQALGNRLDAPNFLLLRQQLCSFYATVFEQHDSGVALTDATRVRAPTLRERFVLPDILDSSPDGQTVQLPSGSEENDDVELEAEFEPRARRKRRKKRTMRVSPESRRRNLEGWLVEHDAHVILGGPGSGKSTLLRFVAIDLLSDAPELTQVAGRWGQHIPVWVPFAFWTRAISYEGESTVSLHEVMRQWLQAFNAQDLTPLIDRALDDRRLLLLVDGLDEYVRHDYGELALDRLRVFSQQRGVPVLLSSRPDGYKLFKSKLSGWPDGQLAELSQAQQRRLAETWFFHQLRNANEDLADDVGKQRTLADVETFFEDLQNSPDLAQLAAVPLLLCLLITLHRAEVTLPRSRFRVYEEVIKHLLEAHPQRRRRAAAMGDDETSLTSQEIRHAFERLAYEMHCSYPEGTIPIDAARDVIVTYLQDDEIGLGLGRREAQASAAKLVAVGELSSGLLVGRSPYEAGFFHRSLQEFLAAGYLSRLDDQLEIVQTRRLDPQWREVLLGTLHFTRQPQQVRRFMELLRTSGGSVAQRQHQSDLLAESVFGEFPVPPAMAQEIARETLKSIEHETWVPQRERLLGHVLDGLRSAKVRDLVQQQLQQWFPERIRYRSTALEVMGAWPVEDETLTLLFRGLYEEDVSDRMAAAKALAAFGSRQPKLFDELARLAMQAQSVEAQSGAVHALVLGWPESLDLTAILDHHATSPLPEQRLFAYAGLAKQGRLTDEQLDDVLSFRGYNSEISYHLRSHVVDVLVKGWPGDPRVRDACLPDIPGSGMDKNSDWEVLFQGFSSDPQVLDAIIKEIREKEHPFIGVHDAWPQILDHFRDVPTVVQAIDARLESGDLKSHELYFASLIGTTPIAKAELLKKLKEDFRHWPAQALLEGWGMDDREVAPRLLALVTESEDSAASVGFLIPKILPDPDVARQRLITLLQDPGCARPDFVLNGLTQVGAGDDAQSILDAAFIHLDKMPDSEFNGANHVFRVFPEEPRVLSYALKLLEEGNGWVGLIGYHLRDAESIRKRLRAWSMPLDPGSRFVIASKLRQRLGDPQEVLNLLGKHRKESDSETRVQCAISLAHRTRIEGQELEPIIESFLQQANETGLAHSSGMQAAIAGLLTLKAFDALATEIRGHRLLEWIPFLLEHNFDTPWNFTYTVMQHWEHVRDVVRLPLKEGQESGFARLAVIETLAPYGDDSPLLTQDLLEAINRNQNFTHSPAVLRFLGRTLPGSGQLLEACLDVIGAEKHRRDMPLIAAQLLGKHFGGNAQVLQRLTTMLGDMPPREDILMALIEGWPESPIVRESFDWCVAHQPSTSYSLFFRLSGLFSTPEKLIKALESLFQHWTTNSAVSVESIVPPLLRRLRQDSTFGTALASWMISERNPSMVASVPRLLADAGVLSEEVREWCAAEIERLSQEGAVASVGIDLLVGRVRPVLHSLLDAI